MSSRLRASSAILSAISVSLLSFQASAAPVPVATYMFQNSLNAEESGVAALTAVDPLGLSGFQSDSVFGNSQTVYAFTGQANPSDNQAGLTFDATGLLSPSLYSVELVFEFLQNDLAWRRVLDVQDRQSDNGLYVNTVNGLAIYTGATGPSNAFTTGQYYHLVLTNDNGVSKAYLDGVLQATANSNVMDVANAANHINLFLDNVGLNSTEYSSGRIALARFYNAALTDAEVANLPASVPEAGSLFLAGAAVAIGFVASAVRKSGAE